MQPENTYSRTLKVTGQVSEGQKKAEDTLHLIKNRDTNKSDKNDNASAKMLHYVLPISANPLSGFFGIPFSLDFTLILEKKVLVPVHKNGHKQLVKINNLYLYCLFAENYW